MFVQALALALLLDIALGDPNVAWHPVRLVGGIASFWENRCRAMRNCSARAQGRIFLAAVLASTLLPVAAAEIAARSLSWGWIVEGVLLYFTIGGTSLGCEVRCVAERLACRDLDGARRALAMLVSRETAQLDESGITSGALETLSENFGDAFVAPLLYGAAGGPLLAWLHRTANTLDAIVGYKTERYLEFGRAAARFDDLLNSLPARCAALCIALSARCCGGSGRRSIAAALRDARLSASPNAGWPMAAFAGALGVRLGGPARYFGKEIEKPFFGDGDVPDANDMERGLSLYWASYAAACAAFLSAAALL